MNVDERGYCIILEMKIRSYLRRDIAVTREHGSWVFLFSPLLIGLFAGDSWSGVTLYLFLACLAGFMIRQPMTIAVKALSGRRSKRDIPHGSNPYVGYDDIDSSPFLFQGEVDDRLQPTARVVGIVNDRGQAKSFPYQRLKDKGVIQDSLEGTPIVVFLRKVQLLPWMPAAFQMERT